MTTDTRFVQTVEDGHTLILGLVVGGSVALLWLAYRLVTAPWALAALVRRAWRGR